MLLVRRASRASIVSIVRDAAALAALLSAAPSFARPPESATASAFVSATVLGPAGADTAAGAVTLSRIAAADRAGSTLLRLRVGGGANASFGIALPETVVVRGGRNVVEIRGLRGGGVGRLNADGAAVVSIEGDLRIPAGEPPAEYAARIPVILAYD
jgi:hypothetical protein